MERALGGRRKKGKGRQEGSEIGVNREEEEKRGRGRREVRRGGMRGKRR